MAPRWRDVAVGDLVVVDWLDAEAGHGWEDVPEIVKTMPCSPVRSVGYVCTVDRSRIVLTADVTNGPDPLKGTVNRYLVVPMGMVEEIHKLKPPKVRQE